MLNLLWQASVTSDVVPCSMSGDVCVLLELSDGGGGIGVDELQGTRRST